MFPFLRVSVRKKNKLFFDTFDIFMIFLRFFDGTEKENNYGMYSLYLLPISRRLQCTVICPFTLRVAGIFMTSIKN